MGRLCCPHWLSPAWRPLPHESEQPQCWSGKTASVLANQHWHLARTPSHRLRTLAQTEDQLRYQLIVPKRSGKISSPKTEHPVSRSLCGHTNSWASLELQQGPLHGTSGFASVQEACGREWRRHRCEQCILSAFKDQQTDATKERNRCCAILLCVLNHLH